MSAKPLNGIAEKQQVNSFFRILLGILLVLTALVIYKPSVTSYNLFNRTWGFDHILFYNVYLRILFFCVCLFLVIPYSNQLLSRGLTWIANKLSSPGVKKTLVFLLLSVIAGFVFYFLNVKYFFLGDFNIRMNQTMKKEFVDTEYLSMRILYAFATFGHKYGYSHLQLFKLYSYIAGSIFVFISCLTADLLGTTPIQKAFLALSQICSALVLVFCGYVEVYATPVVMLTLYIYTGIRFLKSGKGFAWMILSLAFAVGSHVLCLAAAPSLAIAWYFKNKEKLPFLAKWSNQKIALWITVMILAVLAFALKLKSGFLLTVFAPYSNPKVLTLFNYKHFWELLNGQILCSGLAFIFIFLVLAKIVRDKIQLFAEHYFLLGISGCFFLLVFMADLQRGSGDWDIMAFPAVSLNLLTVLLFFHLFKKQASLAIYLATAVVGINALQSFLWLEVNHSDRSIRKIETMLVNDPGNYYSARISGLIQLALTYSNNKLKAEAERTSLMACNTGGKDGIKSCVMYGLSLKQSGKMEESFHFFEDLLRNVNPYIYEAHVTVLEYFEQKQDSENFNRALIRFYDAFCQNPDFFASSINFRAPLLVKLFELVDQMAIANNDIKRSAQIKNVIVALKNFKPPVRKS